MYVEGRCVQIPVGVCGCGCVRARARWGEGEGWGVQIPVRACVRARTCMREARVCGQTGVALVFHACGYVMQPPDTLVAAELYAREAAAGFRPSKPPLFNEEAWELICRCWAAGARLAL